ncbi:MAG: hypothetical protein IKD34_01930, partial [Oscillospiraceae bacterium]|nr:hypothetical protein [Oscillospiraceae bacterium]
MPDNETAMGIFSLEMGKTTFGGKSLKKRSRTLFLTKTASFSFTNSISLGEYFSFPPFPHCFPQGGEKAVFPTRSGGLWGKTRSFPHQNALFPVENRVEKWKSGQKKSQATG